VAICFMVFEHNKIKNLVRGKDRKPLRRAASLPNLPGFKREEDLSQRAVQELRKKLSRITFRYQKEDTFFETNVATGSQTPGEGLCKGQARRSQGMKEGCIQDIMKVTAAGEGGIEESWEELPVSNLPRRGEERRSKNKEKTKREGKERDPA